MDAAFNASLVIFILLFRNSITVDYVPFEHILLEDRGSPLSEGGCPYRINPVPYRYYDIKTIKCNRFIRICNLQFLQIAFFIQLAR